jgi:hypothetical protein
MPGSVEDTERREREFARCHIGADVEVALYSFQRRELKELQRWVVGDGEVVRERDEGAAELMKSWTERDEQRVSARQGVTEGEARQLRVLADVHAAADLDERGEAEDARQFLVVRDRQGTADERELRQFGDLRQLEVRLDDLRAADSLQSPQNLELRRTTPGDAEVAAHRVCSGRRIAPKQRLVEAIRRITGRAAERGHERDRSRGSP